MLFLTNFQHINGSLMKKQTPLKTNGMDENDPWSLSRQAVFLQNLLNHIRLLFCSISDTSNSFFFKRILPLHVCSIFTEFLLTKSSFCTTSSFFKSGKKLRAVFVALWASQGSLEPSSVTILPQLSHSLIPTLSLFSLLFSNDS